MCVGVKDLKSIGMASSGFPIFRRKRLPIPRILKYQRVEARTQWLWTRTSSRSKHSTVLSQQANSQGWAVQHKFAVEDCHDRLTPLYNPRDTWCVILILMETRKLRNLSSEFSSRFVTLRPYSTILSRTTCYLVVRSNRQHCYYV